MNSSFGLLQSSLGRIGLLALANVCIAVLIYFSSILIPSNDVSKLTMTPAAQEGQQVWQKHQCGTCHSIYGLGGHLGPDLTQVMSRRGEAFVRAYVVAGGYKMPAQSLPPESLDSLIQYLAFLNGTGTFPLRDFPNHSFGSFDDE